MISVRLFSYSHGFFADEFRGVTRRDRGDIRRSQQVKESRLHWMLTEKIVQVFFQVHAELGAGHLESVYANAMAIAFDDEGLSYDREFPIAVFFRGRRIGIFRADKLVEGIVLLEYKAGDKLDANWEAQLINYLRNSEIEVGLLLFFGPQPVVKRRDLSNSRKVLSPQIGRIAP